MPPAGRCRGVGGRSTTDEALAVDSSLDHKFVFGRVWAGDTRRLCARITVVIRRRFGDDLPTSSSTRCVTPLFTLRREECYFRRAITDGVIRGCLAEYAKYIFVGVDPLGLRYWNKPRSQ